MWVLSTDSGLLLELGADSQLSIAPASIACCVMPMKPSMACAATRSSYRTLQPEITHLLNESLECDLLLQRRECDLLSRSETSNEREQHQSSDQTGRARFPSFSNGKTDE